MNQSEAVVHEYLLSRGLGSVIHEPDGKSHPPDFLVDGRIAVEARRLNHNERTVHGYRGLEETSYPLGRLITKALAAMGPPTEGVSWFATYTYSRPLPPWRQLDSDLLKALGEARTVADLHAEHLEVANKLRIRFERASKAHSHLFQLGRSVDHDAGGLVVAEMIDNLRICIAEKTAKIARVRERYAEWWLAFEDQIGWGVLDANEQNELRNEIPRNEHWNRIILVNPLTPSEGFEL
jgi:hypothetical protein